jgi:hypothetical protein
MYGGTPKCVFLVFCNAGEAGPEALAEWYMDVHGPDALVNGSFQALHRYEALGDYEAQFLAVWEGSFATMAEARDYIGPRANALRKIGRVTGDMHVYWALMEFLVGATVDPALTDVRTLTLVQGPTPDPEGGSSYRYGNLLLQESGHDPAAVMAATAGLGKEGIPPHGSYKTVFDAPEPGSPPPEPLDGTWITYWRPIGSLTLADVEGMADPLAEVEL